MAETRLAALPGVLGEIAALVGEEAALKLAEARGGEQIYVPPRPGPDHWLSVLIGAAEAQAVASAMCCDVGLRVDIPMGAASVWKRRALRFQETVERMVAEGASEAQIVRATGYTSRAVRRRVAKIRDTRQIDLFAR